MYIETPFNYTGSKHRILDQILPLFDYSKRNFVDRAIIKLLEENGVVLR